MILGALVGTGVGYGLWGRQVDPLEAEVQKLRGWIRQEMRGSDERHRSAEGRIKQLEGELGQLQGALGEAQNELRVERKRRRDLEERVESKRFR